MTDGRKTKITEYDKVLELAEDDEYEEGLLYADFDTKEIELNCGDPYYNYTVPMDAFLEFADRIREKLEEQEGQEITDEPIEDEVMRELGLCGCGDPWTFVRQLAEYLKNVRDRVPMYEGENLEKFIAYMYLCDDRGLTEHGSSVLGAWLTDKGKELLKRLEQEGKK